MLQTVVAGLLVFACSVYAAWKLMPAAGRRRIAVSLLRLPLPGFAGRFLQRHAEAASGCACDGCDRNVASALPPGRTTEQGAPLVFHPRRKA